MKAGLVSDLHVEFWRDWGDEFLSDLRETLTAEKTDVLIVAGDTCVPKLLTRTLKKLSECAPEVVLVIGNHDVYGSDHTSIASEIKRDAPKNVHLLDRSIVEINGVTFAGCTLWADPLKAPAGRWTGMDLHHMRHPLNWMPINHERDVAWLRGLTEPPDVLVTHFMPHRLAIAPQWVGSDGNWYFHVPVDDLVEMAGAQFVCFGHTHDERIFKLGGTKFLCNPRGYPHERRCKGYRPVWFEVG